MPTTPRLIRIEFPAKDIDITLAIAPDERCLVTYGEQRARFKRFRVKEITKNTLILKKVGP